MADRTVFGYPVGRLVTGAIVLSTVVFTYVLVTYEAETVLYAGLGIGVVLVLFAGVVSYLAANGAD